MRILAKIGTSSITDDAGQIDPTAISALTADIAELHSRGHEVLLVTSGAVAAGVAALGFEQRPSDILTLQAVSAVGQTRIMRVYNDDLAAHGLVGAQVLLDPHDFVDRTQYLHARETITRLVELGCIPIINENDAIANDELRYGDNDRLAALVAHAVVADVMVLLTDLDGLYTADPRTDDTAQLVERVAADDPLLSISATVGGSGRGSGGMASKLTAARMASWSGVRTVIARASRPHVLVNAVDDVVVGTTFEAGQRRLNARKVWIAFATEPTGTVVVDSGARRALIDHHTSLLPAGVIDADGTFAAGDVVDIADPDQVVFARGRVRIDSATLAAYRGHHTDELPNGTTSEVIHRDDLVLLPSVVG
ncbi:MAG: glutamate 5-kinase [Ilumatobacter coccineus]|uniref:Glutamate 5-kinase n=1 Tax=Ilumatobacter coccineus TaxID=467094 RepID=A0A2G6KBN2_9ACTN|nr:MAG: glutamate 5-kinase [Ilumatobacter coccineus]